MLLNLTGLPQLCI